MSKQKEGKTMTKTQKIDQTKSEIDTILEVNENSEFCIYVNKTNNFMTIQPAENKEFNIWSEQENDIYYGPYTFIDAVGMAKIFAEHYRTHHQDSFGVRITCSPDELKFF
jgi:hypothetical protein